MYLQIGIVFRCSTSILYNNVTIVTVEVPPDDNRESELTVEVPPDDNHESELQVWVGNTNWLTIIILINDQTLP